MKYKLENKQAVLDTLKSVYTYYPTPYIIYKIDGDKITFINIFGQPEHAKSHTYLFAKVFGWEMVYTDYFTFLKIIE